MLDFRQYSNHSDDITSLYQVSSAARCNSFTPVRRAAAFGGVGGALRRPPAGAVVARLLRCSSPCCAACRCVCSRRRAPCPPSGGRPRAAARCAALRRGRGLSRCFGRCGGLAFRSAGGRCPPRRCPPSFAAPCSPSGCCASLRPRSPSGCAGLLLSCPRPAFGRRVVAAVAARRARSLAPRRAAAFGGVAVRPCGGGAVPPSAPCSRVSPPSGASPRRFRSASPVAAVRLRLGSPPPCQRAAAAACGGRAAAGGLLAAAAAAAFCGALRPPAWGLGFPPLRRRFFRGCCGLASPALLSALPSAAASCALTAALLPRGLFAPPAHFVVQGEVESQGVTRSTTYSAGLLLDIQNKLRIRQNSYYFAELFVDFVNRHCPALLVCSYQKSRWQIWTIRMRRRCCATF